MEKGSKKSFHSRPVRVLFIFGVAYFTRNTDSRQFAMDILRVKEFNGNIFIDPCENCIFRQVFIDMSIHEKVRFKASSPDNYDHQKRKQRY